MNATQQQEFALRLAAGLRYAGLVVERAEVRMGNIKGWQEVPAEGILGRWLASGWRVTLSEGAR